MYTDRTRWNKKYAHGTEFAPPSPLVTLYNHHCKGEKVLDIAAGTGRNALFLAKQGFLVFAVDIADKAVAALQKLDHPNIFPIQTDLDSFIIKENSYDLIINCRFLNRRLFPYIKEGLTYRGILLFESALECDLPEISQPSNKDYLLKRNELLHSFLSLHILYYEEKIQRDYLFPSKTACLAMLAAQNNKHKTKEAR